MIGLIDCNNFYASCERVFRPDLTGKPVAVLSNNDGCFIARSEEAKALGLPMAAPLFKYKWLIEKHRINVFSANFALYGDMSARVMAILKAETPLVEVYSIDEAFIDIGLIPAHEQIAFCHELQRKMNRWTGIPVSIGLGPTKTLAKAANKMAKCSRQQSGIYALTEPARLANELLQLDLRDLWGIGAPLASHLNKYGIYNAWELVQADLSVVRKAGGVVLERTVRELAGEPCIAFEPEAEARQRIMVSRSFGHDVSDFEQLRAAVVSFAARAAEKLRKQQCCTRAVHVYARSNRFKEESNQYRGSIAVELDVPTKDTTVIVDAAVQGLSLLYRKGCRYKKAGIMLDQVLPETVAQLCLFAEQEQDSGLSGVMDKINERMGSSTLRLAAMDVGSDWRMQQNCRSPRYTTRWDELPVVV